LCAAPSCSFLSSRSSLPCLVSAQLPPVPPAMAASAQLPSALAAAPRSSAYSFSSLFLRALTSEVAEKKIKAAGGAVVLTAYVLIRDRGSLGQSVYFGWIFQLVSQERRIN
ncbi:hypothetical protein ABZP36_002517, partial [Zizania latifolia]